MYKIIVIVLLAIAVTSAKPGIISPIAYTSPLVETFETVPVHTSTSSQYFVRNYYGIDAASYFASPAVTYAAEPVVTYNTAPLKYTAAYI